MYGPRRLSLTPRDVKIAWWYVWIVHGISDHSQLHGTQLVLNSVGHMGKGTTVLQDDAVSVFSWTFVLSSYSTFEDFDSNSWPCVITVKKQGLLNAKEYSQDHFTSRCFSLNFFDLGAVKVKCLHCVPADFNVGSNFWHCVSLPGTIYHRNAS